MKFRPDRKIIHIALVTFVTAAAVIVFAYLVYHAGNIRDGISTILGHMSGISAGIVLGYVLAPTLNFIESRILIPIYKRFGADLTGPSRRKTRRQMRKISVFMTIAFFILVVYATIALILPQLIKSIQSIIINYPVYARNVEYFFSNLFSDRPEMRMTMNQIVETVVKHVNEFIRTQILPKMSVFIQQISRAAFRMIGGFFNAFVGVVVAIYLLNSKETMAAQGKKLAYAFFPERAANEIVGEFRFVHYTFIGFITGKVLDSVIIGIVCFIGTSIMGTPFPLLVSFIVGVTNIIPFFGPYIGGALGGILVFMIHPLDALFFLIFVVLLQQVDGNILGPKILGDSTGLSSFWVIFSIMFFGALWGAMGWIIGVPLFSVIFHMLGRITRHYLKKRKLPDGTEEFEQIAYVEQGKTVEFSDNLNGAYYSKRPDSSWTRVKFIRELSEKYDKLQDRFDAMVDRRFRKKPSEHQKDASGTPDDRSGQDQK